MLAAIGVIIISNQAHTVLGVTPRSKQPLELLAEIPHSIVHANPEILILGVASLIILFAWPFLKTRWARAAPPQLIALALAVPMGLWFDLPHAHEYDFWSGHFHVGPEFLVQLPGSLLEAVAFPDFSVVFGATSIKYIVMFALVGTIESTLTVIAVDSIDPEKRDSNLHRDLLATGVGNLLSASVGGLPMISEIVRTKANIDAGARTTWANFSHGLLLLVLVAAAPGLLQTIPLAPLGAMLVFTGTRLASPKGFHYAIHLGPDQLLMFTSTLVVTLATDPLVGLGMGVALKIVLHFARGAGPRTLFRSHIEQERNGDQLRLRILDAAAFTSLLPIQRILGSLDASVHRVELDLSKVVIVDHAFMTGIHGMANELGNLTIELVGAEQTNAASSHPHASRRRAVVQPRRRRLHADEREPSADADDVLLGASVPRCVRPGGEFTARFTACLEHDMPQVAAALQALSPQATHHSGVRRCRWRFGTEVFVVLRIRGAAVLPAHGQRFRWRGDPVVLDFDVSFPADAAAGMVVQKFDVFVGDFRVATIRVDLQVSPDAETAGHGACTDVRVRPARSAFASYAKKDRKRVLDRVASVRLAADLDVFLDCLSLRTGDRYETVLMEQIRQRDLFLLFWSKAASESKWVRKELNTALDTKGEDCLQVHPLNSFSDAPVPERLRHLHFGDLLMDLRRSYRDPAT